MIQRLCFALMAVAGMASASPIAWTYPSRVAAAAKEISDAALTSGAPGHYTLSLLAGGFVLYVGSRFRCRRTPEN